MFSRKSSFGSQGHLKHVDQGFNQSDEFLCKEIGRGQIIHQQHVGGFLRRFEIQVFKKQKSTQATEGGTIVMQRRKDYIHQALNNIKVKVATLQSGVARIDYRMKQVLGGIDQF